MIALVWWTRGTASPCVTLQDFEMTCMRRLARRLDRSSKKCLVMMIVGPKQSRTADAYGDSELVRFSSSHGLQHATVISATQLIHS